MSQAIMQIVDNNATLGCVTDRVIAIVVDGFSQYASVSVSAYFELLVVIERTICQRQWRLCQQGILLSLLLYISFV